MTNVGPGQTLFREGGDNNRLECGCRLIWRDDKAVEFHDCPLHLHAAEMLEALRKVHELAVEIGAQAIKVSPGRYATATVKDQSSRYIRAVKHAIQKADPPTP